MSYTIVAQLPIETPYQPCFFKISKGGTYAFNMVFYKWPTGNCQVSSIAYVNQLFEATKNEADQKAVVHSILTGCYRQMGFTPSQIIIDIPEAWTKHAEQCFDIKTRSPYVSTNGSHMCLCLILRNWVT